MQDNKQRQKLATKCQTVVDQPDKKKTKHNIVVVLYLSALSIQLHKTLSVSCFSKYKNVKLATVFSAFFVQPHETFFQYLTRPAPSKVQVADQYSPLKSLPPLTHNNGAPDHRGALTNINNESFKTPYCSFSIIHQWYMLFN